MKAQILCTMVLLVVSSSVSVAKTARSTDVAGAEQKLRHIATNGQTARPDQTPTVFSEPEINSYLASDNVILPEGVQSVKLAGELGIITGTARVDFDRIRGGTGSSNPLLSIFSGVHDVVVVAHAYGAGRQGYVHVDSVSLDGVEIPRFVLQLFVEKYLQPKHPQLGLDSRFSLPDRLDTATVGSHKLTVTQK